MTCSPPPYDFAPGPPFARSITGRAHSLNLKKKIIIIKVGQTRGKSFNAELFFESDLHFISNTHFPAN